MKPGRNTRLIARAAIGVYIDFEGKLFHAVAGVGRALTSDLLALFASLVEWLCKASPTNLVDQKCHVGVKPDLPVSLPSRALPRPGRDTRRICCAVCRPCWWSASSRVHRRC